MTARRLTVPQVRDAGKPSAPARHAGRPVTRRNGRAGCCRATAEKRARRVDVRHLPPGGTRRQVTRALAWVEQRGYRVAVADMRDGGPDTPAETIARAAALTGYAPETTWRIYDAGGREVLTARFDHDSEWPAVWVDETAGHGAEAANLRSLLHRAAGARA